MDTQIQMDAAAFAAISRSPHWPAAEHAHLAKQQACICCGLGAAHGVRLQVHHKYPFHYIVAIGRPDLEFDERNLFTMCVDHGQEHHLLVGHLDSFHSYNPRLEYFMSLCRGLLASQIRAMPEWLEAVRTRPAPLDQMTVKERVALRAELDRIMPVAAA